jgi:chemotaxis protein MotA
VIFLPVAARLRALSSAEAELRILTLEGILAVQAGDNPRVVGDKLRSFIAPAQRGEADDEAAEKAAPAAAAAPAAEAA